MRVKPLHHNIHVLDLEKSLAWYEKALNMRELRRKGPEDGSWIIVFIGSDESDFEFELTWNKGRTEPYINGGHDTHVAVSVDDVAAARKLHEEMGCVVFDNPKMNLYFIADPDGVEYEILAEDRHKN